VQLLTRTHPRTALEREPERTARALRRNCLAFLLGTLVIGACQAQSAAESLEYRIKAAFVCKFANYVEWPAPAFAKADGPIVIGVIAADAVADELARTAAGVSAGGRLLVVRQLRRGDSIAGVQIIYIAGSDESLLAEALAETKGQPVLIVTESNHASPGTMINFVVVEDKVRFDIAPQVAELSGLKISARLLGVARNLIGRSH